MNLSSAKKMLIKTHVLLRLEDTVVKMYYYNNYELGFPLVET